MIIHSLSWAYASELLVPSLQDEIWVSGPSPIIKKEFFPTPLTQTKEIPDIPEEVILEKPVILVDEHGEVYETFIPEDEMLDMPQIEPEIREAIEKDNINSQLNEEENSFLQTDIFFSIQLDYTQPQLSDENKNIANQIIQTMQKDEGQWLEIVTTKETTGATKLKVSQFIKYLKESGLNNSKITVSLAKNEQAILLKDHTILAIIHQQYVK